MIDPHDPTPASPEEEAAARALAEALEAGPTASQGAPAGPGADAEALAVARLLLALRDVPPDEVGARRLRATLTSDVRRRASRRRAVVRSLAAAAALAVAVGLAPRRPAPVSDALLDSREARARAALAALSGERRDPGERREARLLAKLADERYESYRAARARALASAAVADGTSSGGSS